MEKNKYYYLPKCPKCGTQLRDGDCDNANSSWYPDTQRYIDDDYGTCPNCHTNISWQSVYNFAGIRNLEVEDD